MLGSWSDNPVPAAPPGRCLARCRRRSLQPTGLPDPIARRARAIDAHARSAASIEGQERGVLKQEHQAGPLAPGPLEQVTNRVGRCHGMKREDAGIAHQELGGATHQPVPDGVGSDSALQQVDDTVCRLFVAAIAQDRQQPVVAPVSAWPLPQSGRTRADMPLIVAPRTIGGRVALHRVASFPGEQRIRERSEDRLAVLPADRLERAPGIGHVNRLVANRAEVARGIAREHLEDFPRFQAAGERCGRRVARDSSQSSIAVVKARAADIVEGSAFGSTAPIVQSPSRTSVACDLLN